MAPKPVPERTPCSTLAEWTQQVKVAMEIIEQTETEENWDRMERAFLVLASVVRGGAYKLEADFLPGIRAIARPTATAMLSERSRLSGTAIELLNVIGARLGPKFEPLVLLYVPTILKLCTRSSKISVSRAQNCLKLFAACCRVPGMVTLLRDSVTDKSVTLRFAAIDALHDLLSTSVRDGLPRRGKWVEDVEFMIKTSARDASPETRKMSRRVLASYSQLWPERVTDFTYPLSPTTRRYLEINDTSKPDGGRAKSGNNSAPSSASRPPTLSRSRSTIALKNLPAPSSHTRTTSDQHGPTEIAYSAQRLRTTKSTVQLRALPSEARPSQRRLPSAETYEVCTAPIEPLVLQPPASAPVPVSLTLWRTSEGPKSVPLAAAPASFVELPLAARDRGNFTAVMSTDNVRPPRSAFVPKSRRPREPALAAQIPLPPSPPALRRLGPVHSDSRITPRPEVLPDVPLPTAIQQKVADPPAAPEHATGVALVPVALALSGSNRQPQRGFRPRRVLRAGSPAQEMAPIQRKPSAFGAPAIITTKQPLPMVNASTATGGAALVSIKKNPPLPAVSKPRELIVTPAAVQLPVSAASSTASGAPPSAKVRAALPQPTWGGPTASRSKLQNIRSMSSTSTKPIHSDDIATLPPPSKRSRNATGTTTSQMLKQKPPVQRSGFVPTSKLRGTKSVAQLAQIFQAPVSTFVPKVARGTTATEPELAAAVPLPPSPKSNFAALVTSQPVAVKSAKEVHAVQDASPVLGPDFPTIESIQARLSDILKGEQQKMDTLEVTVPTVMLNEVAPAPSVLDAVTHDEEPEFTLDELEVPTVKAKSGAVANMIAALELTSKSVPLTPSRSSSPNKGIGSRESRQALGEMTVNIDL